MPSLVEILLPLNGMSGLSRQSKFNKVIQELTRKFGGATAFTRAPADGCWKKGKKTIRDEVIVIEVMAEEMDKNWWRRYGKKLASRFDQEQVLIRASRIARLS